METFERGLLSESDLDGIVPRWGDASAVLKIIPMIAERRGFGDILARGVAQAAKVVGGDSWKWAVEGNGLEQSRIETRARKGVALAFAVNPRGPDHLYGWCVAESARTPEAKTRIVVLVIGVLVFTVALFPPPPFLQYMIWYALGGLSSAFIFPLLGALYWPRANKYGALAGMLGGTCMYILASYFMWELSVTHAILPGIIVCVLLLVVVSLVTREPSKTEIERFWGK